MYKYLDLLQRTWIWLLRFFFHRWMVNPSNNLKAPPSGSSTPSSISCWDLRPRFSFCFPLCSDSRLSFRCVNFFDQAKTDLSDFQQITASHSFSPVHPDAEESWLCLATKWGEANSLSTKSSDHINHNTCLIQGVIGTRNFYLESDPGITIGIWQVTSSMEAYQSPFRS